MRSDLKRVRYPEAIGQLREPIESEPGLCLRSRHFGEKRLYSTDNWMTRSRRYEELRRRTLIFAELTTMARVHGLKG